MSPISLANSAANPTATTTNPSELNMEQFMQLLTVQLENQDPLDPMNDRDFFAQMAQLGQVQGMDNLIKSSQLQQAQQLMGKTVTAVQPMTDSSSGQASLVTGVVSRISVKNGVYYLGVQEADGGIADVTMGSLQNVQPDQSINNFTDLIGKNVKAVGLDANGQTITVSGPVISIEMINGQAVADVHNSDGKTVSVAVSSLQKIGS